MSAENEGRAAAEQYRRRHHLGSQALGDLVALIDLVEGIDVAVIKSPAYDSHGLTVRDPHTGTSMLIVVATPHATRLRSTIAHELAHHVFDDAADPNDDPAERTHEEMRADAFARHLLLPLDALPTLLGPPDQSRLITERDASALVQRFAISPAMAAIQLRQARYISEQHKSELMALTAPRLATRFGWSNQYAIWQADAQAIRPPQRLLARANDGYTQGLVSVETIARLEDIDPGTAKAQLVEAGLVVAPPPVERVQIDDMAPPSAEALAAFDADFGDGAADDPANASRDSEAEREPGADE